MEAQKTSLIDIIRKDAPACFVFSPSKQFFKEIGINQKQWGKLVRKEVSPTIKELTSIAEYFGCDLTDLIILPEKKKDPGNLVTTGPGSDI